MTIWFTSDLHIEHRLVSGIRGFWKQEDILTVPDVRAHNDALIESWSVVKEGDVVWVLGDICTTQRSWSPALHMIKNHMKGHKRLICGNHDPVSSIYRDSWKHHSSAYEVFESVQDFARIKVNGEKVLLSHYPYSGTGSEGPRGPEGQPKTERYTEFRLPDCGFPLIHGHTHGTEKLHYSDSGTPQIHVGLDAWNMQLVPLHEIEKLLDAVVSPAIVMAEA